MRANEGDIMANRYGAVRQRQWRICGEFVEILETWETWETWGNCIFVAFALRFAQATWAITIAVSMDDWLDGIEYEGG